MAQPEPWNMMRRMFVAEEMEFTGSMKIGLVMAAAIRESKLDEATFYSNLQVCT